MKQILARRATPLLACLLVLVSAGCGANDSESGDIALPPTAKTGNEPIVASSGDTVSIVAEVRDPDGSVERYEWMRDGELLEESGASLSVEIAESGWHTYAYRGQDNDGLWSNWSAVAVAAGEQASGDFALRLNRGGANDTGRVKILLDSIGFDEPGPRYDVGADDFTIEFRLRGTAEANQQQNDECLPNAWIYGNIVLDRDRYGQERAWGVSVLNGRIVFGATATNGNHYSICGETVVTDDRWHHVAVTRERSGRMTVYVDGVRDARGSSPRGDISYPDDGIPGDFCGGRCFFSDPFLVIGAEKHDAGEKWMGFAGLIDDLRISSGIRYEDDFDVPPHPLDSDDTTLALLHFDEGSGVAIVDESDPGAPSVIGYVSVGGEPVGPAWEVSDVAESE